MNPKTSRILLSVLIFSYMTSAGFAGEEDLTVLSHWAEWSDAPTRLQRHLNGLAFKFLEERQGKIKSLRSAADWQSRREEVKAKLQRIVGPFPEKTPLNPRVVGVLRKSSYRIEKIVFESRPNFFVTGCLFLPDRLQGKGPAILNVIGHTDIAFRAAGYQQLILNLVQKGFIVFAMDPVGQGERLQYYDPALKRSVIGGPTTEHSYLGKQCFLSGSSAARSFTWDGIRAIDFLVSRPEVDPDRIGVTGISGGGTQTTYIAALDERVAAAAPACYVCGLRRLFESIGPQDAEQNLNAGVAHQIDHADFLEVRAPKPTLVVSTTRDFFSIQGARETVEEARRAFKALGAEVNLAMVEDDFEHGYTPKNREAIVAFFQKHLRLPGDPADEKVQPLTRDELTITKTGQVMDSLGGESVFSLNRADAGRLLGRLEASRQNLSTHLPKVRNEAGRLSGFLRPMAPPEVTFRGRYQREGYSVEKFVISGEGKCLLPVLFFKPDSGSKHPALIYLHPEGKAAAAVPGGEIEWFVRQGFAVLSPDLSGTGETGPVDDYIAFLGVQIGRSLAGIRAGDVARCVQYLRARDDVLSDQITAIARGGMAVPLLHAAVFESAIQKVALIEPLVSFGSVVMNRYYNVAFADTVPNALTAYDLPDLEACLAPRPLMLVNVRDQLLMPASQEIKDQDLSVVRKAYAEAGAQSRLIIRNWEGFQPKEEVFLSWLKN